MSKEELWKLWERDKRDWSLEGWGLIPIPDSYYNKESYNSENEWYELFTKI